MAKIVLKDVRIAFAQIWEAKAFQTGATLKYNANFLFPPGSANAKLIEGTIKQVATEKWADKGEAVLASIKGNPNKYCYRDGATKPEYDGYAGNMFVGASSKVRPKIMDRDGKTPLVQADGRPYSGSYVNAILEVWAQDNQFGKGINCSLLGVQFVRDGDAFSGGGTASEDDFEDLSDGSDAPDVGGDVQAAGGGFV